MQLVSIKDLTIASRPDGPECPKSCPLKKIGMLDEFVFGRQFGSYKHISKVENMFALAVLFEGILDKEES